MIFKDEPLSLSVKPKAERVKESAKKWRDSNRQYFRDWYLKNKEKVKDKSRQWYSENPDKAKLKDRRYKQLNRDLLKKRSRGYYAKNPLKNKIRNQRWRLANKWRCRMWVMKRVALKKKVSINSRGISDWIRRVRSMATAVCYYCKNTFPMGMIHFDHIIPLSKGGPHSLDNLCTSCAPCNSSKGSKLIRLWIEHGQQLLEL